MSKEKTIVGLDIGTCSVRAIVGKTRVGEEKPQIIGVGQASSTGMRRGVIVDPEEVVKNINDAIQEAKRSSGFPIESIYVSIGGNHIQARTSKGVIAVSRADEEVSQEDIERVRETSLAVSSAVNRETIYTTSLNFSVDDQTGLKDPVGMKGARLEAETLIIDAASPHVTSLMKCLNEAGLEIEDDGIIADSLAASRAALTKKQKELGVLCLDIGGGTVGMTVFEEGNIVHNHILPIGAAYITNDIAIGLRTDINLAEKIKIEYGSSLPREINKKDTIDLAKLSLNEKGSISRLEVSEIIEARVHEIFDLVNKELKKIDRQGLLPAGVVLTGAGAKIPGLVDVAKEKLRLPAQIGFPAELEGISDEIDDPSFVTAVGLVLCGADNEKKSSFGGNIKLPGGGFMSGIWGKIKNTLKDFKP